MTVEIVQSPQLRRLDYLEPAITRPRLIGAIINNGEKFVLARHMTGLHSGASQRVWLVEATVS